MRSNSKKGNSIATPAFAAIEPKFNHSISALSMSFIEEYAFGDKSQAVRSFIKRAHYSDTNEYEVNEDDINRDLASKEHQDFVDFILSDQLLDFESIA